MNQLTDRHMAILVGGLSSLIDDAHRDGRSGDWVDMMTEIVDLLRSTPRAHSWTHPVGGEPFGTQVTYWSTHWGVRHAIVTSSPKPEVEREFLDTEQWGIVIRPDGAGSGGMTFVSGDLLTLGWHPEGDPK